MQEKLLFFFFLFTGWYHSEYSDAPGRLSCFPLANCGHFRDQQKGMQIFLLCIYILSNVPAGVTCYYSTIKSYSFRYLEMVLLMLFCLKVSLRCLTATSRWSCTALSTLSKGCVFLFYPERVSCTMLSKQSMMMIQWFTCEYLHIQCFIIDTYVIILLAHLAASSLCIWWIFSLFSVFDREVNAWTSEFTSWRQNSGRCSVWYTSEYPDHRWLHF